MSLLTANSYKNTKYKDVLNQRAWQVFAYESVPERNFHKLSHNFYSLGGLDADRQGTKRP